MAVPIQLESKDWLALLVLPILGAVATRIWSRLRHRLAALRWTTSHQRLAFSTQDFGLGKVDILYNGQPAANLHVVTLRVKNDAQVDLRNMIFKCQASNGTLVLRSAAQVSGTVGLLSFAPEYAEMLRQATTRKLTPPEFGYWGSRSDFVVPVLNRGGAVDILLLVTRPDSEVPTVALHCNHLGVRLLREKHAQLLLGVSQTHAAIVGLGVGVVGLVIAGEMVPTARDWSIVFWLIGALGTLFGVLVIRIWRWTVRLVG